MIGTHEYDINDLGKRKSSIPGSEPHYPITIPVCEPDLRGNESIYVIEAMQSTWVSSRGEYLNRFEKEFSEKVGARHGVAVNSGTSALALTMAALGIGPGDEVIVPTFTMVSTVNAFVYLGAKPVFVDADQYYQMKVDEIEDKITDKTKAILPVHIYGHPVDMDAIELIAFKKGIPIVYDGAEAHGALYKGNPIGGRGVATCYSFYGNKILTTGEGGMVVSNDKDFADLCRNLKDVSFSTERHFWHKRLGYNFRMTNLQAAIGVAQTERYDQLVARHQSLRNSYVEGLSTIPGLSFQPQADWASSSCWMIGIEVDESKFGMSRDQLRVELAKKGVETRTYFVPMHLQPLYYRPDEVYPKAEQLSRDGLYLPSSSTLTGEQIDYVTNALQEIYGSL